MPERKHISLDLLAGAVQKRTQKQNIRAAWHSRNLGHAGHAIDPRTSQKIEYQCFSIIIGIMGNSYALISMLFAKGSEPVITKVASRHFNADSPFSSFRLGIKRDRMALHPMFHGPLTHELLIAVTFRAPEMKIAMSYGERPGSLRRGEKFRQTHGVDAAANRKKNRG